MVKTVKNSARAGDCRPPGDQSQDPAAGDKSPPDGEGGPTVQASALAGHRVAVVIPAHNEGRFIGSVVLKTLHHPVDVIVVDDGSTDDTAAIAEAAGACVVRHPRNLGKAAALNTGICEARARHPEAIVVIDGDGQHLPEQLPIVACPVLEGRADIVVGSRYLQKGCRVPRARLIGHRFFNLLTRSASGVAVSDSQSGYRAFSPRAYNADLFHCEGFAVEAEMQFLAHEHGLRLAEVPITVRYSDPPKRSAVRQGLHVLNGVLRLTGQYRPLLFFGLAGLGLLLAGAGWGAWVVQRFYQTRQLAVGYALVCLLLSIFGMILLSTGITLHSVRGLLVDMLRDRPERPGSLK